MNDFFPNLNSRFLLLCVALLAAGLPVLADGLFRAALIFLAIQLHGQIVPFGSQASHVHLRGIQSGPQKQHGTG
jgi:hypothetical protein